jgi:wobble nucleotide-excising tRNase
MITALNMKNIATYDAVNGISINDLRKVNFFFGFNGSGKSTIARYIRDMGLVSTLQNASFNQCSNVGYDSSQHQILTFNEEFIEENFRRSSDFKGVFSLNQSNAIIDQQITNEEAHIQSYEILRDKYKARIVSLEEDKRSKSNLLLTHCWSQRSTFATFTKFVLAHSGSRPNHLQEVKRILQNPLAQVLTIRELTEQYQTLYEKDLKEIAIKVDIKTYFEIRRLESTIEKLLQEIIVGNEDVDIAGLIQSLSSRSWVEQGIKFIGDSEIICPFCQKETIDADLRNQFDKFFDETYKKKIAEIERLRDLYRQKATLFIANITSIQNVFNPHNIVSNLVIALNSLFDDNIETFEYKIGHSNEKKSIVSLFTKKRDLSEIVNQIKVNNQSFKDSDSNKKKLSKEIWKYIANKCHQEIQDNNNIEIKYARLTTLSDDLKSRFVSKIAIARQLIENLRSQTVNTRDAVDEINLILKNAGFEGFEIAEKDRVNNISRYYLKRSNSTSTNPIFDSLSEGEKNYISFLYFYQLCIGTDDLQNNGSKKKIIVIDDPVSSLDSQALFIVSTLIHTLIQRKADDNRPNRMLLKNTNIAQVFILTHNIYFYKEVSFEKRPICTDYWHFKISKNNNQTTITGDYNRSVFDDYSLMWKTIKDIKSSIPLNSTLNIMISNSMRRIIESYVNFIGYGRDSWAALLNEDQNNPSYYVKCAFISTINDESHKITALDSAYYQKIINEQPQILFDVFAEIFKSIGREHYEMMMDEQLQP